MAEQWTSFQEVLARAYVRGWYDGRGGETTDDGKRQVSAELAKANPLHDAAPALLMACKAAFPLVRQWLDVERSAVDTMSPTLRNLYNVATALRDAISKAEASAK